MHSAHSARSSCWKRGTYAHTYAHTYTPMVSYFRSGRSRLGARGIYPSSHFFLPPMVHLLDSQYMHIFALTLIYQYSSRPQWVPGSLQMAFTHRRQMSSTRTVGEPWARRGNSGTTSPWLLSRAVLSWDVNLQQLVQDLPLWGCRYACAETVLEWC